jgi:hypothetical protein
VPVAAVGTEHAGVSSSAGAFTWQATGSVAHEFAGASAGVGQTAAVLATEGGGVSPGGLGRSFAAIAAARAGASPGVGVFGRGLVTKEGGGSSGGAGRSFAQLATRHLGLSAGVGTFTPSEGEPTPALAVQAVTILVPAFRAVIRV